MCQIKNVGSIESGLPNLASDCPQQTKKMFVVTVICYNHEGLCSSVKIWNQKMDQFLLVIAVKSL